MHAYLYAKYKEQLRKGERDEERELHKQKEIVDQLRVIMARWTEELAPINIQYRKDATANGCRTRGAREEETSDGVIVQPGVKPNASFENYDRLTTLLGIVDATLKIGMRSELKDVYEHYNQVACAQQSSEFRTHRIFMYSEHKKILWMLCSEI